MEVSLLAIFIKISQINCQNEMNEMRNRMYQVKSVVIIPWLNLILQPITVHGTNFISGLMD